MKTRSLPRSEFPERLARLSDPPKHLTVCGDIDPGAAPTIAFVGARKAHPESVAFAKQLAGSCASLGAIIVSGGAVGIDAASHTGALDAGGRTWAVLGTGSQHCFPEENKPLFARIAATSGSALFWPFKDDRKGAPGNFPARNRILIALADVVVVIQAGEMSGSRNAARRARESGKTIWVVPGPPWLSGFGGSFSEIAQGARTLWSEAQFLAEVFPDSAVAKPLETKLQFDLTPEEVALVEAATNRPQHVDELCETAGLSPPSAATALLTLALEHVLVEGPPGYYRRG